MVRSRRLLLIALLASAVSMAVVVSACKSDSSVGYGFVLAQQGAPLPEGGVSRESYAGAFFEEPTPIVDCTTHSVGPCALETCTSTLNGSVPLAPQTAGVISITGGLQPVTLTPQDGGYSGFFSEQPLWTGGERITVQAAGAEIGAFTVSTTAPGPVTILTPMFLATGFSGSSVYGAPDASPACPTWTGSTISRSSDLTIRWFGGTPGAVVQLIIDATGTAWSGIPSPSACPELALGPNAVCTFDAAGGIGVVPAAVLSTISPGAVSVLAQVESLAAGGPTGWPTTFVAQSLALELSGSVWGGHAGPQAVYLQ